MADHDAAELAVPAGIAAAWGMRERSAKGPRPSVSVPEIVDAAVRLADAEGLAAVSMSKVAAEVGVTAMALYRYVGNKDELLILMVDAALGSPPDSPKSPDGWRAGLDAWSLGLLAAYRKRPWALRVPITTLPPLPNQVVWMEHGLRHLADTRLTETQKLSSILLLSNLVRGYGVLALDLGDVDQTMNTFNAVMQHVIADGGYPALSQALTASALAGDELDEAVVEGDTLMPELRFGLDRALDGIGALIERS